MTMTMAHGAAAGQLNEQEFIEAWVREIALSGGTRLNPDALVALIYEDRLTYGAPHPTQTRDYVLHCVRLAPHVCRHALATGVYALHLAPECGPACKEAWTRRQPAARGPLCGECFTYAAANGTCACD